MATWTFSGYSSGRGAEVTFTYTASYDQATNKTKVTITNYTSVFNTGGATGYCQFVGTLTVKAADNPGSYGTLSVEHHKGDAYYPTLSTDVSQVIEVAHGIGTSKQISLSFNGTILSVTYSTSLSDDGTNTTVTVASATARTLSISAGTGSSITVTRQSSPWAATGDLTGGTVYDGDVLVISFSVSAGYELGTHTVNGEEFESGKTLTVYANVAIVSVASVKIFILSLSTDVGSSISVSRISSPLQGAETGTLTDGAVIYYNDVLYIAFSADDGYKVKSAALNDGDITSPAKHTVTGAVTVVIVSELMGMVYIFVLAAYEGFLIFIYDGTAWAQYIAYIDNGSSFELYGGG